MNTCIYPWQQDVWEHLKQRYPKLGHALLFYGKHGCGKEQFVQHFVAWLLCANPNTDGACGQCQSCIWFKSSFHPHIMTIRPEIEQKTTKTASKTKLKLAPKIKIEQIREILPFVQQTLAGWRVIIIESAEMLNIAASNALLKTLEEPSEQVILILLSDHYLKLPATIRSRTQHFALDRIHVQQAQTFFTQQLKEQNLNYSQIQQQLMLNLAENMPLYALELAKSDWLKYREEFLNDWLALIQKKDKPLFYATKWHKMMIFTDFIRMLEILICDIIRIKLQQSIYNIDLDFSALLDHTSLEFLFSLYHEIQHSKLALSQNIQPQFMMDHYFIQLMRS